MNREIKYKAWHKIRKELYQVYGFSEDYVFKNTLDGTGNDGVPDKIEDCILLQYTGLKDKKRVEVYEGDIVVCIFYDCNNVYNDLFKVIYVAPSFKLEAVKSYMGETGALIYLFRDLEVIGNIYENPELL